MKEENRTKKNKLLRLDIPEIRDPIRIGVLWLRHLSSESNRGEITRKNHKHSFFEAHFLISGKMEYECGGEIYRLSRSTAVIFPPGCEHTVTGMDDEFQKFTVAFTSEEDAFDRSKALFLKDEAFSENISRILDLAEERPIFFEYRIRDLVFSLLCAFMTKDTESDSTEKIPSPDTRILSAKKYIEDNPHLFLTCEDVARYCHFNPKYLNRIFKKETGKTLLEFIHETKIRDAEKLLNETLRSLSDIGASLGFENEYYFNTFFKRRTGISPGLYRKLVGKKESST